MANNSNSGRNNNRGSSNNNRGNSNNNRGSSNNNRGNSNNNNNNNNGNNSNNNSLFNSNSSNSSNNSSSNSANNASKQKSKTLMIVAGVVLVIILAVAGYFFYRYYKGNPRSFVVTKQFIPAIHDASIDKRINYGSIPESSQGNEYNVNMWVYVNDYVYRKDEDKCILYKGDVVGALNNAEIENNVNTKCNPSVWLLKNVNTLRVLIGLETKYNSKDCNATESVCGNDVVDSETCDIPNFPLQKWVCLNISLRSNVLDIFIDGSLVKSCILEGFPIINKGDLYICKDGGYNGYISNLKYSNKALSTTEITKIYQAGPTLK